MECGGAYAVFDGIDSPVTQTFGLGIFEELNAASLDEPKISTGKELQNAVRLIWDIRSLSGNNRNCHV
jgi:hypothetical protein